MCLGEDEKIIRKKTEEIAEKLCEWIQNQKSPIGSYAVDPHEFLPADVTCDFGGRARFVQGMGRIIAVALAEQNKKVV